MLKKTEAEELNPTVFEEPAVFQEQEGEEELTAEDRHQSPE